MLDTVLAWIAALVWSIAYGWFFARDARRWWGRRAQRRNRAAAERERAVRTYAAWVRNIPPPRSRQPSLPPPPPPPPVAAPRPGGIVIPFPGTAERRG